MHCPWCKGIVGQEISLFLRTTRDSIGLKLQQLAALGALPWRPGVERGTKAAPLLDIKLLSFEEDYRGDLHVKTLKLEPSPALCCRLLELQQQHLQGFKTYYGRDRVRPKYHFSCHLGEQAKKAGRMLDCFVTERKNKCFKQQARTHSNFSGLTFERSVLLRLLLADVEAPVGYSLNPRLCPPIRTDAALQQLLGCSALQCSSALLVKGGSLPQATTS